MKPKITIQELLRVAFQEGSWLLSKVSFQFPKISQIASQGMENRHLKANSHQ